MCYELKKYYVLKASYNQREYDPLEKVTERKSIIIKKK